MSALIYSAHAHRFLNFMRISDSISKPEIAHHCSSDAYKISPFFQFRHYLTALILATHALFAVPVFGYEEPACASVPSNDPSFSCLHVNEALGLNPAFG